MRWIATIIMLSALVWAPAAGASDQQESARQAYQRGEIMSLAEIRRQVLQRFNGDIISTQFHGPSNGRETYFYEFELMSRDGGITRITVRATDSTVIQVRGR